MVLKLKKDMDGKQIDNLKDKALSQIISSRYDRDMKEDGVDAIILFGIAFPVRR